MNGRNVKLRPPFSSASASLSEFRKYTLSSAVPCAISSVGSRTLVDERVAGALDVRARADDRDVHPLGAGRCELGVRQARGDGERGDLAVDLAVDRAHEDAVDVGERGLVGEEDVVGVLAELRVEGAVVALGDRLGIAACLLYTSRCV